MRNCNIFSLVRQFVTYLNIFHNPYDRSGPQGSAEHIIQADFGRTSACLGKTRKDYETFRCFVFLFAVVGSVYLRELENVKYGSSE